MLYRLLQFPARLAFLIWCRNLRVNNTIIPDAKGPLLIAANHPNSFLDAILLCTLFRRPVHALARGDAFKNMRVAKILRALKMLPVYRISEGAENLDENYKTFSECLNIFRQGGIVLIFTEGACVNEWNLRPLKKGTARLILDAWQDGIPLQIIPLGINYSSFTSFGKNVILNFGSFIKKDDLPPLEPDSFGTNIQAVNTVLRKQLKDLTIHIKPPDKNIIRAIFEVPVSRFKKSLLLIPGWMGYILHAPLYVPVQRFCKKKFGKIDHYDSVVVGLLFLLYPLYLIVLVILMAVLIKSWWCLMLPALMPFLAWCRVWVKRQI